MEVKVDIIYLLANNDKNIIYTCRKKERENLQKTFMYIAQDKNIH